MKRIFCLFIGALICLSLFACGDSEFDGNEKNADLYTELLSSYWKTDLHGKTVTVFFTADETCCILLNDADPDRRCKDLISVNYLYERESVKFDSGETLWDYSPFSAFYGETAKIILEENSLTLSFSSDDRLVFERGEKRDISVPWTEEFNEYGE